MAINRYQILALFPSSIATKLIQYLALLATSSRSGRQSRQLSLGSLFACTSITLDLEAGEGVEKEQEERRICLWQPVWIGLGLYCDWVCIVSLLLWFRWFHWFLSWVVKNNKLASAGTLVEARVFAAGCKCKCTLNMPHFVVRTVAICCFRLFLFRSQRVVRATHHQINVGQKDSTTGGLIP